MLQFLKTHIVAILILLACITLGLNTYMDYGVAWDDTTQREIGTVSYNYVFKSDNTLFSYADKDYGVAFELPLIILEKQLGLTDTRDIFLMRHRVTHLFFVLSMFCGYVLAYRLFGNRLLACMGLIILIFHPRIYAHSFFNTKDVPFLSMFLVSLFAIYLLQQKQRAGWYVLAGFIIGYTVATRIMGVVLFGFVSLIALAEILKAYREAIPFKKHIVNYSVFVFVFLLTVYAAWPYLWTDPFSRFISAYKAFSHYRWDGEILFRGEILHATRLPWSYLPIWIGISTPIVWLALAGSGLVLFCIHFARTPRVFLYDPTRRNFTIYFLSVIIPVVAVIALHSVVYDDWRHLYFIYPPLVLMMLYAANHFMTRGRKHLVIGVFAAQLLLLAVVMRKDHPYQQVYFNELVSHKDGYLKKNYEMDYWGCAFKDGLEWLLANKKGEIRVATIKPLSNNHYFLPAAVRNRVVEVGEGDKPYYLVTNYRFDYRDSFDYPLVHRIKAQGSVVLDIFLVK
jgi:hypothetical protein